MTPAEFNAALASLHWSGRGVAEILGRSPGAVRRWVDGTAAVPDDVALWLGHLVAAHRRYPAPATPLRDVRIVSTP